MTDTTREAFEAWYDEGKDVVSRGEQLENLYPREAALIIWQAATERATQVERERAAQECDDIAAAYHAQAREGDYSGASDHKEDAASECAAAIRQGGDK